MKRVQEGRESWLSQRLANRYPPESRVRLLSQSTGQQMLLPAAELMEDAYWWANYNLRTSILNTCDLNELHNIHRLSLPNTFEFRTSSDSNETVYLVPTLVRGKLNGSWLTLEYASDNRLEEFWYGVPTRITAANDAKTYLPVIPMTEVSALSTVSPRVPALPGRLWVTLSNSSTSVKYYKNTINRASIELRGYDIHNREAKEFIIFAVDGTQKTKTAWTQITQVITKFVDDTAFLRIDWLNLAQSDILDENGIYIPSEVKPFERFRFYSLSSKSYGSVLQQRAYSASTLFDVQEGDDSKFTVKETELLSSSGINVVANSHAFMPQRRFIVVTDGEYLHFYESSFTLPSYDSLKDRTTEVVTSLSIENEWSIKGDTINIRYKMTRPNWRLIRTRLSLRKPDGSRVGLTETGAESVYSASGWVEHISGSRYDRIGYTGGAIPYTFTEVGTHAFYLESYIQDNINSKQIVSGVEQTDVFIVNVSVETALSSISLPVTVGEVATIAFDSYDRPWVVDALGNAERLNFHHDVYMTDFDSKALILREEYDQVEVTA